MEIRDGDVLDAIVLIRKQGEESEVGGEWWYR
jgi:hypothetical protein